MTATDEPSATAQEYLETIYNIAMEGDPVVGARLTEKFGVAPPTVTATLQRLARDGYLTLDRRRGAALTARGVAAAEATLRRHRLVERFLFELLHMDWIAAHEEAHALEHSLSPAIEAHLVAALGDPTTCPHGNPIPGSALAGRDYLRERGALRLADAPPGRPLRVLCLSEVVEDETALLRQAGAAGLRPGRAVRVDAHTAGGTAVAVGERTTTTTTLLAALATRVWVVADGAADSAHQASVGDSGPRSTGSGPTTRN